jgi:hypothetical protein
MVVAGPVITARRELMICSAARHRLPVLSTTLPMVPHPMKRTLKRTCSTCAGALPPSRRVLSGATPTCRCNLPTNYSLVVNLKAAQGARFAIPAAVLAPVDQVIRGCS